MSETQEDLEGVEAAMDETANSAGNSAEELEGFSQRFQGAMSAAVAGLAVGAAGLLSQVPVVGEAMSGLFAIVEAVAFQMDSVLRPVLSPIGDFFFDIANAIFEADGALGTIIGAVASFVSIAAVVLAAIVGVVKILSVFAGAIATVVGALGTIISVVGAVASALAGLISLPALLIAAFVALAAALIFNVGGARDRLGEILSDIWDFFVDLAADLADWAGDLASDAFDWGRDIITRFIGGLESMVGVVREVLEDMPFIGQILSLFDRLTDALDDIELSGSAQANISQSLSGAFGGGGGGGNSGRASSRPRFGAATGGGRGGSQIDGRQITESTGRYRSGSPNRRGL